VKPMSQAPVMPLNNVVALHDIAKRIQSMNLNELIKLLNLKDVIVWPLQVGSRELFISKDFETRHRDLIWASQLGHTNAVNLFFNVRHAVKLYREKDLYKIALGFLVHEAYEGILKLALPEVESEVKVYDRDLGVVGVADLVSEDYVVEVKSGKRSKKHELQMAVYMKALGKNKGYIVYPHEVVEVEYAQGLVQELKRAVNDLKRLRKIILNSDLNYITSKFVRSYENFKELYKVEPKRLEEILKNEGFLID